MLSSLFFAGQCVRCGCFWMYLCAQPVSGICAQLAWTDSGCSPMRCSICPEETTRWPSTSFSAYPCSPLGYPYPWFCIHGSQIQPPILITAALYQVRGVKGFEIPQICCYICKIHFLNFYYIFWSTSDIFSQHATSLQVAMTRHLALEFGAII